MQQPLPVQPLTYARTDVDAQRDLDSLDRAMTARLCRTFGIWLLVFAGVATIGVLQIDRSFVWQEFIPFAITLTPGLTLLLCVKPIKRRSRAAVIIALVATLWTAAAFGLALFWIAYMQFMNPYARGLDAIVMLIIFAVLLLACVNLLYHMIRLLVLPGRGASNQAVRGALESLGATAREERSAGLWRLGLLRIASAILAALTAIAFLAMNSIVLPPPPPPPVFTPGPPFAPPTIPPLPLPQQGDIMLESSRLAGIALLATAVAAITVALRLMKSTRNPNPAQPKALLAAHITITAMGAAAIAWLVTSIWLDNPQYHHEMRGPGLLLLLAAISIWMILIGLVIPLRALRFSEQK